MVSWLTACSPVHNAAETSVATELSPTSVLVSYRFSDYDTWKRVFDDLGEAREDASCLGHSLKRGIDDADTVFFFCPATDEKRLRDFLDSEHLAESMSRAGVQGTPTVTVMRPASRNLVSGQKIPGIIMLYSVSDYDTWRLAYDGLEDFRLKSGIVGQAVGRKIDDPNFVVVYHQARNVANLRAFVESAELEKFLERSGARGDLDIHFIRVVGFDSYR
jgi:hypothetical protein